MTNSNKDKNDITGGLLFFVILMAIPLPFIFYNIFNDFLCPIIFRNSYFKAEIKIDSVIGHSSEGSPVVFYGIGYYKGIEGTLYLCEANEDDGLGKDSIKKVWIRMYNSFGKKKLDVFNRKENHNILPVLHLFRKSFILLLIWNAPFLFCLYFYLRSKKRQRLRKIQNMESGIEVKEIIQKLENNEKHES